jgi:hypothetical protein
VLDAQACRHFTNNNFDITGLYMVPAWHEHIYISVLQYFF